MKNSEKVKFCHHCPHWKVVARRPICGKIDTDIHAVSACPEGKWAGEPGVLEKTGDFVDAYLGRALGEVVSDEEYEKRRLACFGKSPGEECDQLKRRADGRAYCGLCGCGSRDEVLLDEPHSKLRRFARIECKLGKFGKVDTVKTEFPQLP